MKKHTYHLAIAAIIANTIIWSAASPILKWAIDQAPPFTIAFFRFLLASLILLPIVWKNILIEKKDFHKIIILSVFGIAAHVSLYFLGLSLAPSINVPIITSSTPLFLIIGAIIFLHEKPKKKVILGTLISFIGVSIIVLKPFLEHANIGSVLGNVYHVLSVITFVIYTLLLKKYNLKYPFSTLLFWMFFCGALFMFPLYLFEMSNIPDYHIDVKGVIGILYSTFFSSLLGYFCYNYAVKYIKANEVGIFSYTEPFITALVAIPLLNEQITFGYLLGALFVFAGIVIAESKFQFHPGHNLRAHHDQ